INGLLIPPEDFQALTQAVFKILEDKTYSSLLGQRALEMVQNKFTAGQMADQISQIYQSIYLKKQKDRTHA
ncbi:MAG TPA: hypothetical protein VK564_08490, partial [Thermodesulfobacteriota bacterium]|nr:hypothetical protein [Thermodesulfobacteriota bacterium]